MAEIKVLDKNTIDQIAAGEVVERPASIVKELVENAVDAKATSITVEIKGGGIDFIRITDNGSGIEKDQVRTAFFRHATSKITRAEDLMTVASLGFRGEALSSIAAVSKVELITKTDEGISGVRYQIEGGEERSFEELGCPEGTTFVVRNLFYNTPARRKFLKSKMTEAGYVESFLQRLALSHPDISFKFINDNKNKIATAGNGRLKDVIYNIFGRDAAMNLLEVSRTENGITVEGFIGKPSVSRGNRNYENYFVNGRYLKNTIITKAIEEGYKGHAMVHKFPFTVLMISMDSRLVDVNVHPAKMEMRFQNGEEMYSVIVNAVRSAFVKKDLIPETGMGKSRKQSPVSKKNMPEPFEKKRRKIEERFASLSPERIAELAKNKKQDDVPEKESTDARDMIEKKLAELKTVKGRTETRQDSSQNILEDSRKNTHPASSPDTLREGSPEYGAFPKKQQEEMAAPEEKEVQQNKESAIDGTQMMLSDIPLLSEAARPKHRMIGQVFRTYWMVEFEDKLYFVDQHAAHEKVLYEKFRKNMEERTMDSQMVAPPVILNLSIRERQKLESCKEAFAQLGYQIDEFGEDAYCIRAVPSNLLDFNQQDLFMELLDEIDDSTGRMNLDALTDRIAGMACKAAVKGNMTMSLQEMDSLMDQLLQLENPYQCPHGRPTIISMSRREIEKKFHRIQ